MAATTNINNAVNKLHAANTEKGFNDTKKANLEAALTSVKTDLLEAAIIASAPAQTALLALAKEITFALEMGAASHTGSGKLVMSADDIKAEYMHTESALAQAQAAVALVAAA